METTWTEFVGYDENGIPVYITVTGIPEANQEQGETQVSPINATCLKPMAAAAARSPHLNAKEGGHRQRQPHIINKFCATYTKHYPHFC